MFDRLIKYTKRMDHFHRTQKISNITHPQFAKTFLLNTNIFSGKESKHSI